MLRVYNDLGKKNLYKQIIFKKLLLLFKFYAKKNVKKLSSQLNFSNTAAMTCFK